MAVESPVSVTQRTRHNDFPYDEFMANEGLPVHREQIGIADVTKLERKPWARMGGTGAFIQLEGTFQSERGIYVAGIPGGGALEPIKHLYEEEIFVLEGRGIAQVWQGDGEKLSFEWGPGSVFAFPGNTTHRLLNGGREDVVFLGVNNAPRVMNALHDWRPTFDAEVKFIDLYAAGDNYFLMKESKATEGWYQQGILNTNFIPDSRRLLLDDLEQKVSGGQLTGYRMGARFPHGHISEWPSGRYHKAHYHGPGAILLGLDGEGYVLAWDAQLGPHPYQNGHGDQVYRVEWGRNSIYVPPDRWFHQHFNSGAGPAKHIAVYGETIPMGVHGMEEDNGWKGFRDLDQGGTLIEFDNEDPQIRKDFEATLRAKGLESKMPPVTFRG